MIYPRVLSIAGAETLEEEFRKIGVDRGGIPIMSAKGILKIVKIFRIPVFWANILKQEMLSLGADAAISRSALTGQVKVTDAILIATLSQYQRLFLKIKKQPFGLASLIPQVRKVLSGSLSFRPFLDIKGQRRCLGRKTLLMGIVNVTPDSFSGDGVLDGQKNVASRAWDLAHNMVEAGADIIDVGGESTRPGARRVSVKDELARIVPVMKIFRKNRIRVPVSIDTTKSEVARAAMDLGASIINDISALRFDKKMVRVAVAYRAAVVLMHMQGSPRTMQQRPFYGDVMQDIWIFLSEAMERAQDKGIGEEKIILDPGIGFGKTLAHNIEILKKLSELKSLGRPILVGASRKRCIGEICKTDVSRRAWGTAAAIALSVAHGADIVRVHDVTEAREVARVADVLAR
jgi:dihydropteroate synthase